MRCWSVSTLLLVCISLCNTLFASLEWAILVQYYFTGFISCSCFIDFIGLTVLFFSDMYSESQVTKSKCQELSFKMYHYHCH